LLDSAGHAGAGRQCDDARAGRRGLEARRPGHARAELLDLAIRRGLEGDCQVSTASYFLSRMTIVATSAPGMRRWEKELFMALAPTHPTPVVHFRLPVDRMVVLGSHVTF
jgi:K+ transporter